MMGVPWLSPVPGLPDSLDNDPGQEHANAVIAAALAARGSRTLSPPGSPPLLEISCRAARFVSREDDMRQVRGVRRVGRLAAARARQRQRVCHEKEAGLKRTHVHIYAHVHISSIVLPRGIEHANTRPSSLICTLCRTSLARS